jgi:phosphoenolpyruvate carboxykinase (ATP)
VPTEILDPRNTWSDKKAYDEKANRLAWQFDKFAALASDTIREGAPQPAEVSNEYNHN